MNVRRPERIFKYVGPDRLDILVSRKIRFTQPAAANDPFEGMLALKGVADPKELQALIQKSDGIVYLREAFANVFDGVPRMEPVAFDKALGSLHKVVGDKLQHLPDDLRERHTERGQKYWSSFFGILSLTEEPSNLLMWAHYAAEHTGAVIEFDPAHSFFNQPGRTGHVDFGQLAEVDYRDERRSHRVGQAIRPEDLLVKSTEWRYEKEWRVFQLFENGGQRKTGTECYLFDLPADCIKRVVLGCRMDPKTRREWLKALEVEELKHVRIEQAKPHLDCFKMVYTEEHRPIKL